MAEGARASAARVALVTGATRGIGREIAAQLVALGYDVWVAGRDVSAAEAVAGELGARHVQLDVTDAQSVAGAAATVESGSGLLDVLVNNAGIDPAPNKTPFDTDADDLRATFEVNVFGVVTVLNAFVPLLRRSASARIVNVSSGVGSLQEAAARIDGTLDTWVPSVMAYAASKAALNSITLAYAKELKDEGILVNSVSPGLVATALTGFRGGTPAEGARIPVLAATLADDGPTAAFIGDDGSERGRRIPW